VDSGWQSFYCSFPLILSVFSKLRDCIGLMSAVICLHYKRIQQWAILIGFDKPRSTLVSLCIHCSLNLSPLPMLVIAHSACLRTLYCVEYEIARPTKSYSVQLLCKSCIIIIIIKAEFMILLITLCSAGMWDLASSCRR
jgi:hypothetical protein